MSSLQGTQNLDMIVVSSLAFILDSFFFATYGTYLKFVLFSVDVSLLLTEQSRLFSAIFPEHDLFNLDMSGNSFTHLR